MTRPRLTLAQARLQLQLGPTDPRVRPRYEPQQADLVYQLFDVLVFDVLVQT